MLMQTANRLLAGEPFVPPYGRALASRLEALVHATGLRAGIIDRRFAPRRNGSFLWRKIGKRTGLSSTFSAQSN